MSRSALSARVVIVLVLLLVIFGLKELILGGAKPVNLKNDPLISTVESSFNAPGANSYMPIEGIDYSISGVNKFANGWAVVRLEPIDNSSDPGKVVLKQSGSTYQIVKGPSNFFTESDYDKLPADVSNFIRSTSTQDAK